MISLEEKFDQLIIAVTNKESYERLGTVVSLGGDSQIHRESNPGGGFPDFTGGGISLGSDTHDDDFNDDGDMAKEDSSGI